MRRLFWTVVLYVALGAVISQLVAGALMYFGWEANRNIVPVNAPMQLNFENVRWSVVSFDEGDLTIGMTSHHIPGTYSIYEMGGTEYLSMLYGSESRLLMLPRHAIRKIATASEGHWRIEAAGWPVLSAYYFCEDNTVSLVLGSTFDAGVSLKLGSIDGGIPVPTESETALAKSLPESQSEGAGPVIPTFQRAIPYLPAWPGLAVNTVFYALLLWAITHPRFFWRFFAKKDGHCRKCGYDVAAGRLKVCPECGAKHVPT